MIKISPHPRVPVSPSLSSELNYAISKRISLLLVLSIGFGCHTCDLPKLFTQMAVAVEAAD